MIGVDTNVILRLFTDDQPHQTMATRKLMEKQRPRSVRIDNIVLVELVWTLSRLYKSDRQALVAILAQLLQREELVLDSRGAIVIALRWFENGRADFADYLIAALNEEAGAAPTYTFDRLAAQHIAFSRVAP